MFARGPVTDDSGGFQCASRHGVVGSGIAQKRIGGAFSTAAGIAVVLLNIAGLDQQGRPSLAAVGAGLAPEARYRTSHSSS